jgi:hypothetical protein
MSEGLKITPSLAIALIMAAAVLGCEDVLRLNFERVVPPACAEQYSSALTECTKAGNPLSDEEGEDLVAECRRAAADAWGAYKPYYWKNITSEKFPCDARCYQFELQFEQRTEELSEVCRGQELK